MVSGVSSWSVGGRWHIADLSKVGSLQGREEEGTTQLTGAGEQFVG